MEPVTHILTGACLGRTGLNRRAAYTTAAMAVAAEFPDIDTLWSLRGPVASFTHHRGLTHSFIGIPFEAALITALFWGYHRLRKRPHTAAPVRWGTLYAWTVLALLSHILLDWTNNYGVRPLLPFDGRWHAASIVFIFDPLLFAILVLALALPALFRLIAREVGARREPFPHTGWARLALIAVLCYWGVRFREHQRAVDLAASVPYVAGKPLTGRLDSADPAVLRSYETPRAVLASPDPLSVTRWHIASDTGDTIHLAVAELRPGTLTPDGPPLYKAAPSPALRAAEASALGRAYLDWSPMPVLSVVTPGGNPEIPEPAWLPAGDAGATTEILFRDPRFMGAFPVMGRRNPPPLSGSVTLDAGNHVLAQRLDGKLQR